MKHLAVYKNEIAEAIMDGKVSVDIRLSKLKSVPFGLVSTGDIVLVKIAGKDIIGQFRVKKVITLDGITKEDLIELKRTLGDSIVQLYRNMDSEKDAKYAVAIFIGEISRFITSPFKMPKKRLRKVWEVLG